MENKNWWEQATQGESNKTQSGTKIPWYNQKSKLNMSILIWPLWLYGLYKTDLYTPKTKVTWLIVAFIIITIISLMNGINGNGS